MINADYGLGVIIKKNTSINKYKIISELDEYKNLTYYNLDKNRKEILNLIDLNDLNKFINLSFNSIN